MAERIALHEMRWQLAGLPEGRGAQAAAGDAVEGWLDIPFPATVRHAHLAVGRTLPDGWENLEWVYRCGFPHPPGKDRVVRLCLAGCDYRAAAYLNGEPLGDRKGAYGPAWYDVSNLLAAENRLVIVIKPIAEAEDRLMSPNRHPLRWPNAGYPVFNDAGVWDDVTLWVSGPVYFEGWLIHGESTGDHGDLSLRLEINNTRATTAASVRLRIEGDELAPIESEQALELATGRNEVEHTLTIPGARSWNPHTQGEPVLYRVRGELRLGGGVVDVFEQAVGFRSVKVARNVPEPAQQWRVHVNGRAVHLRGLNWAGLPPPAWLDYATMVRQLREAGVNAVRVWGGRHRAAFYEACDREGILVLQEFPMGLLDGKTYPREAPDFPQAREIVRIAKTDNNAFVRHLRNHPSIFLWVGGTRLHNQDNAHVMRTIEDALRVEDGTRPYVPVLPGGGAVLDTAVINDGLSPEHLEDGVPLLIANGLPAWPGGKAPQALPARWRKYGGERTQARGIAWAAGAQRYRDTAGGFIGELVDWSPEGGFGYFDFQGRERLAWRVLQGLYGPVAAGLAFDWQTFDRGSFDAEAWMVRDDEATTGEARVWICSQDGTEIAATHARGDLSVGRGVLGEVLLELQGGGAFTAYIQATGGKPVPYPLEVKRPPSSYSLAEIAQLRLRLKNLSSGFRPVREIGILGLLPLESFLRSIFALRLMIGL